MAMARLGARRARGFTLTELAVVVAIIGLLLASALYTLSAQTEQRNFEETRRRLEAARELLLAFAIVNGRLPCPAIATSNGDEAPLGGGTCTAPGPYGGWLPARSIGFQVVDTGGYDSLAGGQIELSMRNQTPARHRRGERQMLAIGRALMSRPKLLMLDEPSFGLAPILVQNLFEMITRINQ